MSQFVGSSDLWNNRLAGVFTRSDTGASRSFFEFVLSLVSAGITDGLLDPRKGGVIFWYPIEEMARSRPEWACELVAAYLERLLSIAGREGDRREFPLRLKRDEAGEKIITEAASAAPHKFVELMLKPMTTIMAMYSDPNQGSPRRDRVWGHGAYGITDGLDNRLLAGLESSLCWLAANEPDQFRKYASALSESEFATMQNLLLRANAAGGEPFADEAVEFLLENVDKKFSVGYVSISTADAVGQLIRVASPSCSTENFSNLEQTILNYYPEWERKTRDRHLWGASQMRLLNSLEPSRLSQRGTRRLQELRRKFGDPGLLDRRVPEGGSVVSPIPELSARKMNDDEWLGAIERYSSKSSSDEPRDLLIGGPQELSQLLEGQTREDPVRFSHLIRCIPDDSNRSYFQAILRGLEGADIDMETVVQACLRCHKIPGRPLGRWVTSPLIHFAESQLPEEALEMVAWYATKHTDPEKLSSNTTYMEAGKKVQHYDPISVGINSVRGSAAGTIAKLLIQDERHLPFFEPHLKLMVKDPSDATRACVAEALLGVLRHNRDLAVQLFIELCNADERLLATGYFESFLKYAVPTHFTQLKPILARMMKSQNEDVATAGSRRVCYASLLVAEALPAANLCLSGSKPMRMGAAQVYSDNLKLSEHRSISEEILGKLFSDSEIEVRHQAARCFYELEGQELQEYDNLIVQHIQSPAFEAEHNSLFTALKRTTADMPHVILMASERVFELAGDKTGDISSAVAGTSSTMAKLIFRVYNRTTDHLLRSRCLNIIDKMSVFMAHGLDVITDEFDR